MSAVDVAPVLPDAGLDPERAALVAGLRALADLYATNPDLPLPYLKDFDHCVIAADDEAGYAEIARIAEQFGVEPSDPGCVERQFGGLRYRAFYSTRSEMARYYAVSSYAGHVEPDAEGGEGR